MTTEEMRYKAEEPSPTLFDNEDFSIYKKEWQDIGKKAQWEDKLPMPLYDDINKIQGEIMAWVEGYMDNYPQEQWKDKQSLIYSEIAKLSSPASKVPPIISDPRRRGRSRPRR